MKILGENGNNAIKKINVNNIYTIFEYHFLNDNDIWTPSEYLKINTDKDTTIMKKWNPEMVNSILRNENYTGTLF